MAFPLPRGHPRVLWLSTHLSLCSLAEPRFGTGQSPCKWPQPEVNLPSAASNSPSQNLVTSFGPQVPSLGNRPGCPSVVTGPSPPRPRPAQPWHTFGCPVMPAVTEPLGGVPTLTPLTLPGLPMCIPPRNMLAVFVAGTPPGRSQDRNAHVTPDSCTVQIKFKVPRAWHHLLVLSSLWLPSLSPKASRHPPPSLYVPQKRLHQP